MIKNIAITALILVSLMLALIGVLSMTRDTPVTSVIAEGDGDGPPAVTDPLFEQTIEMFTRTHIETANAVQILLNGDGTYPPLWRDLASAQRTITVQLYFCEPGAVADTMAKYLSERARAKVRVLLLLDAFGAGPLKDEWIDGLKAAGVEVVMLRPLKWYTLHKTTNRSHVRAIVIDGRVGYTGGFGLADYWLGDGHRENQWRESNVRFEGPTVGALQATFAAGWAEATGELITGTLFFPKASFSIGGNVHAGLMHSIPTIGSTPAERFFALSIAGARKTLYITNSYFVPGGNLVQLLLKAEGRGVDVRVLTVSAKTDVKTTWYAGRAYYEQLLEGGVRIYEYSPTMMHAKSLVVDGIWGYIGSMNFDNRSIAFNDESNLVVHDPEIGARMDSIFVDDTKWSDEIRLETFKKRSIKGKTLEWVAQKLRRIL